MQNITRTELDAHYECLAQNADVTDPLSASVVVKMYRKCTLKSSCFENVSSSSLLLFFIKSAFIINVFYVTWFSRYSGLM